MSSGLIKITNVTGTSPNWVLTVENSGGVAPGDHVAASLDGLPVGDGAPFRVLTVPDSATINVADDLKPGAGTYGKPASGDAQYYTPTTNINLSLPVDGGPFWGESLRRDNQVLDSAIQDIEDEILRFTLEATLLAATPVDGTIAFAEDTNKFWLRESGVWVRRDYIGTPTDGDYSDGLVGSLTPTTSVADAIDALNEQLLDTDSRAHVVFYTTETILLAATPVDGTVGFAQDTGKHWSRTGGSWTPFIVGVDRVGWVRIVNVLTQSAQPISNEVYDDPPNNTIIQSLDSPEATIRVVVESSFPRVTVDGNSATLPPVGSVYKATVDITVAGSGDVVVEAINPDGDVAARDTVNVTLNLPPTITGLSFTGGYPGAQSELKENDSFDIQVTADKPFDQVEIIDFEACKSAVIGVGATTSTTVTSTVADRGDTAVLRPARVRVRDASTGAFSATRDTDQGGGSTDGIDVVNVNNLHPSVSIGAITYPGVQQALKGAELATVVNTVTDFDTVLYDDPTGTQLTIAFPTSFSNPKNVNRAGGSYNVTVNNFRITANRAANDATTVDQTVVNIANVAAAITVSEPAARLRSGGNDGTSAQNHTITISSDQNLLSAPSLDPDSGGSRGVFIGGGFAGGPAVWTRSLQVHDDDDKGTFTWENLSATNLAGIVTTAISGDSQYVLGGFVARSLTYAAFATQTPMDVEVVDFSKLTAGIFTATNQPALKQSIGTSPPVTNGYTIDATGVKPTQVIWLDTAAAGSNSGGTAQITNVEETV